MYSITVQADHETQDKQKNGGQTKIISGFKSVDDSHSCMNILEKQNNLFKNVQLNQECPLFGQAGLPATTKYHRGNLLLISQIFSSEPQKDQS